MSKGGRIRRKFRFKCACGVSFFVPQLVFNARPFWGPFQYYVSKDVGGWGQKMAIFAELLYYSC